VITTAAIAWALIATALGIAVYFATRREVRNLDRMGYGQYARAEKLAGELASIKQERRRRASHARACQIERERARIAETTARLAAGK
jgi:hypothetical protein